MPLRYDAPVGSQSVAPTVNVVPPQLGLASMLGNVAIGRDLTGQFAIALGLPGLAVARSNGTWVALDGDEDALVDATPLVVAGLDPFAFRLPMPIESLQRGDIVIALDSPFSPLFVLETDGERQIIALDPMIGQMVMFMPPQSLFFDFVIRVVSLIDLVGL